MAVTETDAADEIAELRARVDRLEGALRQSRLGGPEPGRRPWEHQLPWAMDGDKGALHPIALRNLRAMGITSTPTTVTAEELTERQVEEGLDPAARVFQATRAEMRGEQE